LNKETPVDLAFFDKLLSVNIINPYAFDDLKDFISYVELVVESRVGSSRLALDVEFHQSMQQKVVGKFDGDELIAQNASLEVHKRPGSGEEQRHQ
jgi:hypothetical protein